MDRSSCKQRPLFPPQQAWHELPESVRANALDVLIALYLETVEPPKSEPETDDSSQY